MSISRRLLSYLDANDIIYELVHHAYCETTRDSARSARVPEGKVAKGVLLKDADGYLIAVLPASCDVNLEDVELEFGRQMEFAREPEIGNVFEDSAGGAVPPVGVTFDIPIAVDESLLRMPDVYFEAGNHVDLVHVSGACFRAMLKDAACGSFRQPHWTRALTYRRMRLH